MIQAIYTALAILAMVIAMGAVLVVGMFMWDAKATLPFTAKRKLRRAEIDLALLEAERQRVQLMMQIDQLHDARVQRALGAGDDLSG